MAHSLSAKKRIRQAAKKRAHNRSQKAALRALMKRLIRLEIDPAQERLNAASGAAATEKPKTPAEAAAAAEKYTLTSGTRELTPFQALQQKLDRLATRGLLHKNTVARTKSRLARRLNKLKGTTTPARGSVSPATSAAASPAAAAPAPTAPPSEPAASSTGSAS